MKPDIRFGGGKLPAVTAAIVTLMTATGLLDTGTMAPVAPRLLSETGLYAPGGLQVDRANRPFTPQYPLWTDGAAKRRWVRLPDGAPIDISNLDRWEFPSGTRFWKEFAFQGRKVETRMLWKSTGESWTFASYAWNDEQTDAVLVPDEGRPYAIELAPGKRHSIPGIADCRACHDSSRTEILGFDALQLSTDRDAGALHAEPLTPEMVTLRTLVEEGLVRPRRTDLVSDPPRIDAPTPDARAALGYLSTNCGSCHNPGSTIASLGLFLKHPVRRAGTSVLADTCSPALATTLNQRGHWVVPSHPADSRIIRPGRPDQSALVHRARSRRPSSQMPPLGTVIEDTQGVDLLTSWIADTDAWAHALARCAGS